MPERESRVRFEYAVVSTKFSLAVGFSCTLHLAVAAGVMGRAWVPKEHPIQSAEPLPFAGSDRSPLPSSEAVMLPVEVEGAAASIPPTAPDPEPAHATPPTPNSKREGVEHSPAGASSPLAKRALSHETRTRSSRRSLRVADSTPLSVLASDRNPALQPDVKESPATSGSAGLAAASSQEIDQKTLHQAMQAAATNPHPSSVGAIQPMIRVDRGERNLDRAFARAFAPAFSADRSLFTSPPLGHARFEIRLADDGRIADVTWLGNKSPPRIKSLVAQMVKLLSLNRFNPLIRDGESVLARAYDIRIYESHVSVPSAAANADAKAGEIWMLGAGDTPTIGHPSHPAVADATGHLVSCELRIVETLPALE